MDSPLLSPEPGLVLWTVAALVLFPVALYGIYRLLEFLRARLIRHIWRNH